MNANTLSTIWKSASPNRCLALGLAIFGTAMVDRRTRDGIPNGIPSDVPYYRHLIPYRDIVCPAVRTLGLVTLIFRLRGLRIRSVAFDRDLGKD